MGDAATLERMRAHAARHGGRLLLTFPTGLSWRARAWAEHIIVATHDGAALMGDVTALGGPYRPDTWPEGETHTPPHGTPAADMWARLDHVRPVMVDEARWERYDNNTGAWSRLDEALIRKPVVVRPRAGMPPALPPLDITLTDDDGADADSHVDGPVGDLTAGMTAFWRVGPRVNQPGRVLEHAGDADILWNADPTVPTYVRSLADHAAAHGGRVLFCSDGTLSAKMVGLCRRAVICAPGRDGRGEWVEATVGEVGAPWARHGWPGTEPHQPPSTMLSDTARLWVSLDDVVWHPSFDPSRWSHRGMGGVPVPFGDVLAASKQSSMLIEEVAA